MSSAKMAAILSREDELTDAVYIDVAQFGQFHCRQDYND